MDPKDDDRRSPLFRAANYGADGVVKLLMERGADVTIRDTSLKSVVHAAVGDVKSMDALLQVKVAIGDQDHFNRLLVDHQREQRCSDDGLMIERSAFPNSH